MTLPRSKIIRFALYAVILALVMYPVAYLWVSNSEPYDRAEAYLRTNSQVRSLIGQVTKTRLAFSGFSVSFSGSSGWAELEIVVSGDRRGGLAAVELEKVLGAWDVVGAHFRAEEANSPVVELLARKEKCSAKC